MKQSSNFHLSRLLTSLCLALLLTSCAATPGGWLAGGACGPTQQHDYEVGGTITTFDDGDNSYSGHEYDRDMISVGVDYRFAL